MTKQKIPDGLTLCSECEMYYGKVRMGALTYEATVDWIGDG